MQESADVGIVLGHIYTGFGYTRRQKRRMDAAAVLLRNGKVHWLMTTGGKGMWKKSAPSMAEVARDYLIAHGIPPSAILVEKESTSTVQNAQYALHLMQQHHLNSLIIVTSADHMPRAKAVFEEVFPSDYQISFAVSDTFSGVWSFVDFFWNIAGNLKRWVKKRSEANRQTST
jgi:uncharacterized SAM-binding protein YcdF (DUF218 family)